MKAHSYNEWSRLIEVVVGTVDSYPAPDAHDRPPSSKYCPSAKHIAELAEDIEEFVGALHRCAITVRRPAPASNTLDYSPESLATNRSPALHIRDQAIVLGDEIVEAPPWAPSRLFENQQLNPIFYEYFMAGAKWTAMPRPQMTETVDSALGADPTLDATQCLRFGKDVLVNIGTQNHMQDTRWLRRHLKGVFRFHIMELQGGNRIDSLVSPLRPGALLVGNPDIAAQLPEPLRKWETIFAPDAVPGINVFSIDESTVIVNSLSPELISTLEAHRFTVVPVRQRHCQLFGGGFHRFTLDTVRAGKQEDYFGGAVWSPRLEGSSS